MATPASVPWGQGPVTVAGDITPARALQSRSHDKCAVTKSSIFNLTCSFLVGIPLPPIFFSARTSTHYSTILLTWIFSSRGCHLLIFICIVSKCWPSCWNESWIITWICIFCYVNPLVMMLMKDNSCLYAQNNIPCFTSKFSIMMLIDYQATSMSRDFKRCIFVSVDYHHH